MTVTFSLCVHSVFPCRDDSYLLIVCFHAEIGQVGGEAGEATLAVGAAAEELRLGVHAIQLAHGVDERLLLYLQQQAPSPE